MRPRLDKLPLFWRVFAANANAIVLAGLLVVDLILLRTAFAPLDALADTMRRHDPLAPGARAGVPGDPDLAALHDEVGQTLTGVMLQVEGLASAIPEELRRIARRLRPDALDELGLHSAMGGAGDIVRTCANARC